MLKKHSESDNQKVMIEHTEGWIMAIQRYQILMPGTCKCYLIWKKDIYRHDERILSWGDYSGLPEWALNVSQVSL